MAELQRIAKQTGDVRSLVAPKKRDEATQVSDQELLSWLAADGSRVRRPIIVANGKVTLGFAADARESLAAIFED